MRILIVSAFFSPSPQVGALRPSAWAKYAERAGHEVSVLTVDRPWEGPASSADSSGLFPKCKINRVAPLKLVRWLAEKYRSRQSKPQRALREATAHRQSSKSSRVNKFFKLRGVLSSVRLPDYHDLLLLRSWKQMKSLPLADVLITSFGPPWSILLGLFYKKKHSTVYWVADFRDLWTQNSTYRGLFGFRWIEQLVESLSVRNADLITVVTDTMAVALKTKYGPLPIEVLENGFDAEDSSAPIEELKRLPQLVEFFAPNKVNILYTGALHKETRNPLPLLQALAKVYGNLGSHRSLQLFFAGPTEAWFTEKIEELGLRSSVFQLGRLPRRVALAMQREADILLLLEAPETNSNLAPTGALTTKAFEYLQTGREIWILGPNPKGEMAAKLGQFSGVEMLPSDANDLPAWIVDRVRGNSFFYGQRQGLERYSRQYLTEKLLRLISQKRQLLLAKREL